MTSSTASTTGLLKVEGVEGGDGEQVALGEGGGGVVVGVGVPHAARAHGHALFLLLAHGDHAHVLVAAGEALVLHALLHHVRQVLGQAGAQVLVVALALQVRLQHARHDALGRGRVELLLRARRHAVGVGQLGQRLHVAHAPAQARDGRPAAYNTPTHSTIQHPHSLHHATPTLTV